MEQNQDSDRRAADQKFQESLEQLEDILQTKSPEESKKAKLADTTEIDLAEFEDAVADIEAYFDQKGKE